MPTARSRYTCRPGLPALIRNRTGRPPRRARISRFLCAPIGRSKRLPVANGRHRRLQGLSKIRDWNGGNLTESDEPAPARLLTEGLRASAQGGRGVFGVGQEISESARAEHHALLI